MKRLLFIMIIAPLLLTACSNASAPKEDNIVERKDGTTKEKSESDSEKDEALRSNQNDNEETESGKENNQQKQDSNPNANKEKENKQKKDEPLIKYEELTVEEILAMTIIEQKAVDYPLPGLLTLVPTPDEIFAGEYTREFYSKENRDALITETNPIDGIQLVKIEEESFEELSPNILEAYMIYPMVVNSYPQLLVEEEHVILYSAQTGLLHEYDSYPAYGGQKYSIRDMYERNKYNEDVLKLVNMTETYNDHDEYMENHNFDNY